MSAAAVELLGPGRAGLGEGPGRAGGAAVIAFPRRPSAAPPGLHLTRRGRLARALVLAAALVVLLGAGSAGLTAESAAAESAAPAPPPTRSVVVQSGQTLWQIASAAVPQGDVRDTMVEIRDLNGMGTSAVLAGQELRVPRG